MASRPTFAPHGTAIVQKSHPQRRRRHPPKSHACNSKAQVMSPEIEISVLTATFDSAPGREADVAAALAKYVVLTRHLPHCRNVDLVTSTTLRGRFLVIEKWDADQHARAHLSSETMVDMAAGVVPYLADSPTIDLWDSISAHDLH